MQRGGKGDGGACPKVSLDSQGSFLGLLPSSNALPTPPGAPDRKRGRGPAIRLRGASFNAQSLGATAEEALRGSSDRPACSSSRTRCLRREFILSESRKGETPGEPAAKAIT
eukprot:3262647-Pyramimonas_sp.AAC.1